MKDSKDVARQELLFCLDLWNKKGSCSFGTTSCCESCGAPYLLYKICTGSVIHDKRLALEEWRTLVNNLPQE